MGSLSILAVAAVLVVGVSAGCGGSSSSAASTLPTDVQLDVSTAATGGKALVFTAATAKKLASQEGGHYAMELRGVPEGGSLGHPTYVDPNRCMGGVTCEWTLAPAKSGTYDYQIALIDLAHDDTAGQSNTVRVKWVGPRRPEQIRLLVNGKVPPTVPLAGDDYSGFAAGPMRVQAKWTNDARDTGYYLRISIGNQVYARCSTGTSCAVPGKVPLNAGDKVAWTVELLTTEGNKVAGGFKACLEGEGKKTSSA